MGADFGNNIFSSYNYQSVETDHSSESHYHYSRHFEMNWVVAVLVVVGALVVLALLCRCCCGSKSRGRVLAPPADHSTAQPPYPQQQYAAPYIAAVPVAPAAGPYYGAPYPHHAAAPLHAPPIIATGAIPAPYPQQQYVYAAVSPYPAAGAPYPAAAPYPATDGYPHPQPHPQPQHHHQHHQPQAPNAPSDACPPSYEQVMGACDKQPPYNPHAPH